MMLRLSDYWGNHEDKKNECRICTVEFHAMAQVVASIACVWLQNVKLLGYAVVGVHPHIRINIKDMKDSESLVY